MDARLEYGRRICRTMLSRAFASGAARPWQYTRPGETGRRLTRAFAAEYCDGRDDHRIGLFKSPDKRRAILAAYVGRSWTSSAALRSLSRGPPDRVKLRSTWSKGNEWHGNR